MASVQRRTSELTNGSTSTRWRARYRDRRGVEVERSFGRRVDAQRWIDAATASIVRGDYVDPRAGMITVGEWAGKWLDAQAHLKPATRSGYAGVLRRYVLPAWADRPLVDVQHAEVAGWVSSLGSRGLAASTVRHAHRVLSQVLGMAVRDGRLARNVADGVPLPRARRAQPRFLTHAEVEQLAAECPAPFDLFVRVLAYTGLRFGEATALRAARVDLMRRRVQVVEAVAEVDGVLVYGTPKTHQERSVPLPRFLIDPLAELLAGRRGDELVFTTAVGAPLRNTNFRHRVFDPAVRRAGLDHVTPHDLRDTAASLAVSAGANVKAVQRMLGHASAAMTLDVYADLFSDDLDAVGVAMNEAARSQVVGKSWARPPMTSSE